MGGAVDEFQQLLVVEAVDDAKRSLACAPAQGTSSDRRWSDVLRSSPFSLFDHTNSGWLAPILRDACSRSLSWRVDALAFGSLESSAEGQPMFLAGRPMARVLFERERTLRVTGELEWEAR